MKSQIEQLIDICGLALSGTIPIVIFTTFHDLMNPPLNYRETGIDNSVSTLVIIGFMLLLMIVQMRALTHRFNSERLRRNRNWSIVRLLIPTLILCAFLFNDHPFPGASAPTVVRQQWAMREFHDFGLVVKSIQQCQPIVDRVGKVALVAPTDGQNYISYDPGSSGHYGELTLEVVGESSTGVANFKFRHGTFVASVQWTHQNSNKTLKCR